jgi:hypothetical protein
VVWDRCKPTLANTSSEPVGVPGDARYVQGWIGLDTLLEPRFVGRETLIPYGHPDGASVAQIEIGEETSMFRQRFLLEASFAVEELARRGGYQLTEFDRAILGRNIRGTTIEWRGGFKYSPPAVVAYVDTLLSPDLTDADAASVRRIISAAFHGFFDAAADGLPLTQLSAVASTFGRPVQTAYPGAGPAFKNAATTYWTMRTLVHEGYSPDALRVSVALLHRVERLLGPLFFPEGPDHMDKARRAREQRKLLANFALRIDADEFVAGNPMLS